MDLIQGGHASTTALSLCRLPDGQTSCLVLMKKTQKIAGEFDSLGIVVLPYEEAGPVHHMIQRSTVLLILIHGLDLQFNSTDTAIVEDITIPCSQSNKNKTEIENIWGNGQTE